MSQPAAIHLADYQAPAWQVLETRLTFELEPSATRVTTVLTLECNPDAAIGSDATPPLVLNGEHLTLERVSVDGRVLASDEFTISETHLTLDGLPARCELETVVVIDPAANTALEGLYVSSGMFCTQCEAEGFRRITYYPDRPDVMSVFTTTVIGDKAHYPILLSNGNPVERGELEGGRHFVTWQDPHLKPCYLFALVAGDLVKHADSFTTMSGRDVALEIWVEPENLDKTQHAMTSLKASMKWDEEVYGREYDLDIFMIVAVNDFNMGAMENKGLNIFNSSCVLANHDTATDAAFQRVEGVVAHEYFHNWSGNRVTCRDWFQLSLKEGFTVYRDQSFSADMNSAPVKRIEDVAMLRTAQFAEDAGPTAHPVRPASYIEISNFYTLTIYEKGSEVVRMVANLLGKGAFRRGSDLYFAQNDGRAATIEDFISAMSEASGRDFTQFMRWYAQAGTPEVAASGVFDATAKTYTLTLRQTTAPTPGQNEKLPLVIPVRMGLVSADGHDLPLVLEGASLGSESVLELTEAEQSFVFTGIEHAPVPSLLRGFSAPVKLGFDYSREQLAFLMQHDSDGFNRWECGQRLALAALEDLMAAFQRGDKQAHLDERLLAAYRFLLTGEPTDRAVLVEMLTLPSEAYIAEQQAVVDVDAIHWARKTAKAQLATVLREEFVALYHANEQQGEYAPTFEQMARRSLKNAALSYLMGIEDKEGMRLAQAQLAAAHNMTDVRAALTLLVHSSRTELGNPALKAFAERWSHDPLVMDQWFAIQVTRPQADVLDRVRFLMEHPAFSLTNPNKVRALIGTFAGQNRVNFHRIDGEGYRLLADVVIELNRLNPDIAARIITPLTRFKRFDAARQALMKTELERIRNEKLSRNVYEVVEKALA
ncbi:MAG: aminopeptidase N [Cobetia crustatorum]